MRHPCRRSRRSLRRIALALFCFSTILPLAGPVCAGESLGRLILTPDDRERLRARQGGLPESRGVSRQLTGELSRRGVALKRWSRDPASGEVHEESGTKRLPPTVGQHPDTQAAVRARPSTQALTRKDKQP